jgi:hypothetical protein
MADDNEIFTPAQFREHQDGFGVREPDAHSHTGVTRDALVSRYLSVIESQYDPRAATRPGEMPGQAHRLDEVEQIRGMEATETARTALEAGDSPTLKHLMGDDKTRADISGMKAIGKIDQLLQSPAPVIVVLGEMGSGKTDFAGLLGQRARDLLGIETVASNIRSLKETDGWTDRDGRERDGFVPDYPTLKEWVRHEGNPLESEQSPKLFIGDEFSSHASGSGKAGYETRQKMGPLVYKIRKYDGMLIYIAHDESSIHPMLWRLGVIVKKTSKKTAVVADKVKNGELRDEMFEIEGVPPTDWRFRTEEASEWAWTVGDDEEEPDPDEVAYDVAVWTVRECKRDGLSHRQTAAYVPFGKSWVGDRWEEIQDGQHVAAMDRVEAMTA